MTEQILQQYNQEVIQFRMTRWDPDTCYCAVFIDDKDGNDQRLMRLIKRCRVHKTVKEVFDHNQLPKHRTGTLDKQLEERNKSREASR